MRDHYVTLPTNTAYLILGLACGAEVRIEADEPGVRYRWLATQPGTWCEASTAATMTAAAHAGAAAVEQRRRAAA